VAFVATKNKRFGNIIPLHQSEQPAVAITYRYTKRSIQLLSTVIALCAGIQQKRMDGMMGGLTTVPPRSTVFSDYFWLPPKALDRAFVATKRGSGILPLDERYCNHRRNHPRMDGMMERASEAVWSLPLFAM
jgi:hypothetical protein